MARHGSHVDVLGYPLSGVDISEFPTPGNHSVNDSRHDRFYEDEIYNFSQVYYSLVIFSPCSKYTNNQVCATLPQKGILDGFFSDTLSKTYNTYDSLENYQIMEDDYY